MRHEVSPLRCHPDAQPARHSRPPPHHPFGDPVRMDCRAAPGAARCPGNQRPQNLDGNWRTPPGQWRPSGKPACTPVGITLRGSRPSRRERGR